MLASLERIRKTLYRKRDNLGKIPKKSVDKWGVAPSLREPPPYGRYTTFKNTPTAILISVLICWYRLMI